MAVIDTISIVEGIHGKIDGSENLVFTKRYGRTHAWEIMHSSKPATPGQLAVQAKFKSAQAMVKVDMANPEKKAEWQAVADASNGKWKTARGAAFASYFSAPE